MYRSLLQSLLNYLHLAEQHILAIDSVTGQQFEATWFMKIAWNIALQSTGTSLEMKRAFEVCQKVGAYRTNYIMHANYYCVLEHRKGSTY